MLFSVEKLSVTVAVERVCQFVNVEAAGRGIDNVFIDATFLVEFIGIARLFHASIAEGVNHIGVNDLTDAVADDDDGAVALDGIDACFDLFGGNSIEAGGGLVEENDGGILEEHAGNGDALLLSAAEGCRLALHAFGQFHHLVVDVCFLSGFDDFSVGGFGLAITNVFLDGAFEDMVLLKDETDMVAKEQGVVVAQVNAIVDGGTHGLDMAAEVVHAIRVVYLAILDLAGAKNLNAMVSAKVSAKKVRIDNIIVSEDWAGVHAWMSVHRPDGSADAFDTMAFYHFVEGGDGTLKVDKCWIKENIL